MRVNNTSTEFCCLLQRNIRIDKIRASDQEPGVRDFEANLLRLLDKISNGCSIEINETGTSLRYRPGYITGGKYLEHDCALARGIGYYLEPLLLLGLFAKKPIEILLRGVTNHPRDPSIDTFRAVTLPLLKSLGIEEEFELKTIKRGAVPKGGGEVFFRVPTLKRLPTIDRVDEGMVKRIRGIAFSTKTSPQVSNRMVDGARGVFNDFLADVYIFTDHMAGEKAGLSPGYGLSIVAETTTGCYISAERCIDPDRDAGEAREPEALGEWAARALVEEIQRGGVVDGLHQSLVLTLCAVGPEELHRVRTGPLVPGAVRQLRLIKKMVGVRFSIAPEKDSATVVLSCVGAALRNTARRVE